MKLKNQLIISIAILGAIFLIIFSSYLITNQQVSQLNNQEQIALGVQTGASDLNYLTNDFFLFQQSEQITLFESKISSLANDLSKLNSIDPTQAILINNTKKDLQKLDSVFGDAVMFLENAPRNVSVRVLPAFQTAWSRLAVQSQTLTYDSVQLSQTIRDQSDQLNQTNSLLVFAMVGAFAIYFITIYFLVFRRTFRSITRLQDGTKIIGSGNLDYSIAAKSNDEIGELSSAFNQMTTNLKTITASKTDLEKAQTSLRESEQRWATILASIGDAVIATDTSSKIVFMNSEAEELTGWAISESLEKPVKTVFNIVNEQTRLEVESPIDRVLREGLVVGLANHTVLIRKDGSEVLIDDSGAPIRDRDNKTTGVVLVFRDITERKKADEALGRQAELIDLTPDAIIVQQLDGTITFWSKGAEKLYGWTKNEAIGQDIHTLLNTEFPHPLEEILEKVKLDGKWSGELTHECKNGKLIVQSYWLGKFAGNGKIESILESNVDITERVQLQRKLEESAILVEEYANQMEELANQRAAQLKDAERLATIGATAGMVGHDIRNPLQAITGDVFLAKTELIEFPESEEKKNLLENLNEIEKNIDYINKIVQDLQDFARPLNPIRQETNLKVVIEELLEKNGVPKNIKVTVKVETAVAKIVADSTFINRIMYNLVNNAVQAMPKGGKLTITAYKEANDVVIAVKDTGVGIPEKAKSKLFTPLFTTKSKGQGFGLAVIKRMTEALGGTVSFESEEGKGTTFTLYLPQPLES